MNEDIVNEDIVNELLDEASLLLQKDEAFHAALVQIMKNNPLPGHAHDMHHANRGSVLRRAKGGQYRHPQENAPGNRMWREVIRENLEVERCIPVDEVIAVHMLIYG
jgi:hypothetical protein